MRLLNKPIAWWGTYDRETSSPPTILELIRSGTLSTKLAADLWTRLESGSSMLVAASPPRSGKTTLLTALLAFLPLGTEAYFTRGWGETFNVPPRAPNHHTYLLINELSDHLPVYSWGPYARRAFDLLSQGYSMASTIHADTPEEVMHMLQHGLGVPPAQIAKLDLCVTLRIERDSGRILRRVNEVSTFRVSGGDRVDAHRLWRAGDGRFEPTFDFDADPDRRDRTAFLESLLGQSSIKLESLVDAISSYKIGNGAAAG